MAIDTAAKRRSSSAARLSWLTRRVLVAPDGTISAADRQTLARTYAGIDTTAAADVNATSTPTITAGATSTATMTATATSTATMTAAATSTPSVSDG